MAMTLQHARTTVRTVSGFDALAGLWLIAAPFVLAYSGISSALWNSVIFGIAILVLATSIEIGNGYRHSSLNWISVAIGAWLMLAPFVLGFGEVTTATWNHVITGVIVAALALSGALATPHEET